MSKAGKWFVGIGLILLLSVGLVEQYYKKTNIGTTPGVQTHGVTVVFENEQDREEFIKSVYKQKYSEYPTSKDSWENGYRYHIIIMDETKKQKIKKEIEEMSNINVKTVQMY